MREAEKLKRTLSANEQAIVSIASLMNDIDFQTKASASRVGG